MNFLDQLKAGVQVASPEEMHDIAKALTHLLPEESVLALEGDLGCGKTTFVAGLAKAWGIQQPVTSPTFNLYSIYQGDRQLVHLDAYRLNNPAELDDLLLEEFLIAPYCFAIEWPEKLGDFVPKEALWLVFSVVRPGVHRIQLIRD